MHVCTQSSQIVFTSANDMTEDEMVGWSHRLKGHEFEQPLGVVGGWTGKPGMLQSMGSQRVRHDRTTKLNNVSGMGILIINRIITVFS